ncbi:ankyrin repeat-containing domain protein [Paraphoma chrysanthemicola]|nr:ankyrin repeat-containing domain protein [Paraphoma chrysanthemicola]
MTRRARDSNEDPADKIPASVCERLCQRLLTEEEDDEMADFLGLLPRAILLKHDAITMALCIFLEKTFWSTEVLIDLLGRSRVDLISGMISQYSHLHDALRCVRDEGCFDALDDILYRMHRVSEIKFFPGQLLCKSDMDQQVALRVLFYHAAHTNDYVLLRWLLRSGLQPCELHGTWDIDNDEVTALCEYSQYTSGRLETPKGYDLFRLPSLVAVAASQNNTHLIEFLRNEGVNTTDSLALMRAAGCNADEAVVNMLSGRNKNELKRRKDFGVAAMRAAIYKENYNMLGLLSNVADINGYEPLTIEDAEGKLRELPSTSALGEAILRRNLRAARFLIEKGVDLNGLVARGNYEESSLKSTRGTVLQRASPLIAAIDSENLPMVQLLVEHGAEIDHGLRLGLIRTPLQRAAEIGKFDMVQYLLERGAPVDSAPVYSGGTPLQLAAIGGYVGIATLLLENGADPDHLPAKGHGRTALEAATEWSRVDMMSLLVSKNVKFDLVVGDNNETQYNRAIDFAEKRGQIASVRFLKRLRDDSLVDFLNV